MNNPAPAKKKQKSSWYLFNEPIIYIPLVLFAAIAWFAPPDVMDRLAFLKPWTRGFAEIFLPMGAYIKKSSFPQITELYFFLAAIHSPLHIFFVGRSFENSLEQRRLKAQALGRKSRTADFIGIFILIPVSILFFFYLNRGVAMVITPIHDNRFFLGIFGWIYAGALGWALAGGALHSLHERLTGKLD